jgi:hypothetical protein
VRSFLLVPPDSQFTFQRSVRSLQLSAREASGVRICARICGSYFFISGFVSKNPETWDAPKEGRLCRHFRNWSDWGAKEFAPRQNRLH